MCVGHTVSQAVDLCPRRTVTEYDLRAFIAVEVTTLEFKRKGFSDLRLRGATNLVSDVINSVSH